MFVVLYRLLRLLGKRELSQMTPFEFFLLVVMGDLIQQGVTQNDFSVTGATLAIVTFAFWGLLLSWVAYLFPRVEDMLDGEPRLIISHGKLLKENFRRDRLTKAEIETEMRLAGIARSEEHTSELQSLMRISYAVFCLKKKKNTKQKQTTSTS